MASAACVTSDLVPSDFHGLWTSAWPLNLLACDMHTCLHCWCRGPCWLAPGHASSSLRCASKQHGAEHLRVAAKTLLLLLQLRKKLTEQVRRGQRTDLDTNAALEEAVQTGVRDTYEQIVGREVRVLQVSVLLCVVQFLASLGTDLGCRWCYPAVKAVRSTTKWGSSRNETLQRHP